MAKRPRHRSRGPQQKVWSDHYTEQAKAEGYAARSVYKLAEIHRRFPILRPGQRVVDLGCSPGSWAKFAREHIAGGTLVGVDIQPPDWSGFDFVQASALDVQPQAILDLLGGPADVVLSDMAPHTSGNRLYDHVQQLELAARAAELARDLLVPGGAFVCKVFDGEDAPAFIAGLRPSFDKTKRARPEAVRKASREFFLVCLGFRSTPS